MVFNITREEFQDIYKAKKRLLGSCYEKTNPSCSPPEIVVV
jgi:hypothetical protein